MATIGDSSAQMALRDPDIRLMLGVREDQPGAFEQLVALYQHRLVGVMHHLVGNVEEAEDLAQEVFLRVYRARKKYRPRSKFSTWLFTIANHLAQNALRSRRRKPVVQLPSQESGPFGARPAEQILADRRSGPLQRVQKQELATVIRQALDGLSERQRLAVVLNKYEDMDYATIAQVMGLTVQAVKSLLSRARMKLRAALAGYIYMDGQAIAEDGEAENP